jgi:hypothetical protein
MGNRLYVWADGQACCGGTRFIKWATEPPDDAERFALMKRAELNLFVRPAGDRLPEELRVGLKGGRRPRVEASWNGCAYLV